ncbi:MAG: discoidin domain-containing protein [Candidatus Sericytochromatia bacterium]
MRRSWWMSMLALALVGCHMPSAPMAPLGSIARDVTPDGEDYRGGNTFRVLAAEELPIVAVAVDSEASGFGRARLADGDRATQWVNGGYRNPTSWAAVQLAAGADLAALHVKTGAMPVGTAFDVEVSDDGLSWRSALTNQRVTTWNLETLALPAGTTGQWVRLNWRNDPAQPQAHFSVYELAVLGAPQATPAPTPTPSATPSEPPSAEPSAVPSTDPTPPPDSPTPPPAFPTPLPPVSGPVERLTPRTVTANSAYAGLSAGRAIDGNQATQWANGGYQDAEAWLNLDFETPVRFERIALKTGTQPAGVRYQLESSFDGATWTPLGAPLANTTWGMETKAAPGEGRHLRIRFLNAPSAPVARFYLFELEVYGHRPVAATPTPEPTIAPTPDPSPTPTEPPSPTPGETPSPEPVPSPSPTPEPSPSAHPTAAPSVAPTVAPPSPTPGPGVTPGWETEGAVGVSVHRLDYSEYNPNGDLIVTLRNGRMFGANYGVRFAPPEPWRSRLTPEPAPYRPYETTLTPHRWSPYWQADVRAFSQAYVLSDANLPFSHRFREDTRFEASLMREIRHDELWVSAGVGYFLRLEEAYNTGVPPDLSQAFTFNRLFHAPMARFSVSVPPEQVMIGGVRGWRLFVDYDYAPRILTDLDKGLPGLPLLGWSLTRMGIERDWGPFKLMWAYGDWTMSGFEFEERLRTPALTLTWTTHLP